MFNATSNNNSKIRILSIGTGVSKFKHLQSEIAKVLNYSGRGREIFLNSGVLQRYLFLEKDKININESPDELLRRYESGTKELGKQAIYDVLKQQNMKISDINYIITTSCTGYLCPSLSFRYIKEFGMKESTLGVDIQGMGCGAALPAIKQAYNHLLINPEHNAIVLSVEICSASFYLDDNMETLVANAIFSDGAAAMLLRSSSLNCPCVVDFESCIDSKNIDKLGFSMKNGKLRIILSKHMKELISPLVGTTISNILKRNNLNLMDVKYWVIHPGGKNIIDGLQEMFSLTYQQLIYSRLILRDYGNMSSPSVMFVLNKLMQSENPNVGDVGIMVSMGPGLSAYAILLKWV